MTKLSFITILGLTASGLIALSSGAQAEVIDLTGTNNSGRINRAEFDWTPEQPTGTGLIQPFLRVQANPAEQGYNTSGGTVFDDKGELGLTTFKSQI